MILSASALPESVSNTPIRQYEGAKILGAILFICLCITLFSRSWKCIPKRVRRKKGINFPSLDYQIARKSPKGAGISLFDFVSHTPLRDKALKIVGGIVMVGSIMAIPKSRVNEWLQTNGPHSDSNKRVQYPQHGKKM